MPASVISRDQSAHRLDLMTFDVQTVHIYPINLDYVKSTSGVTANNAGIKPRGFFTDMDGQLSIVSDNSVSNLVSVDLFSVKISIKMRFFHRL